MRNTVVALAAGLATSRSSATSSLASLGHPRRRCQVVQTLSLHTSCGRSSSVMKTSACGADRPASSSHVGGFASGASPRFFSSSSSSSNISISNNNNNNNSNNSRSGLRLPVSAGCYSCSAVLTQRLRQHRPDSHQHHPHHCRPEQAFFQQKRGLSGRGGGTTTWYEDLCDSQLVHLTEETLTNFHGSTGLPWWCCIVATTVVMRTVATLPLAVYSQHVLARLANLGPEVKEMVEILKYEAVLAKHKFKLCDQRTKAVFRLSLNKRIKEAIERENCHPMKATVTVLVQAPLWIALSLALRNISVRSTDGVYGLESFQHEGILHITNLALPDPLYILPICVVLVNLVNVELYNLRSNVAPSGWNRVFNNALRFVTLLMLPIAANAPSGVVLYWLSSACMAMLQSLLLMSPSFRRMCRIPLTETELPNPYSTMATNLGQRLAALQRPPKSQQSGSAD